MLNSDNAPALRTIRKQQEESLHELTPVKSEVIAPILGLRRRLIESDPRMGMVPSLNWLSRVEQLVKLGEVEQGIVRARRWSRCLVSRRCCRTARIAVRIVAIS